jgi:anaerobic selenocysteine-containing dehydrogenase
VTTARPDLGALAPILLYRTLGPTLPAGAAAAAILWGAAQRVALANPEAVRRAGFGEGGDAGERLFDAIMNRPSGVVFTEDEVDEVWRRVRTDDGRLRLTVAPLLAELASLGGEVPPGDDPEWPFLLSAGERRSFTANTIMRDPGWRKRDTEGALRMSATDAERLGLVSGATARVSTRRGSVVTTVEVLDGMQPGHLSLPNGLGLDHPDGEARIVTGVAPNELTASEDRDPWAGTPWHKSVPARVEAVV